MRRRNWLTRTKNLFTKTPPDEIHTRRILLSESLRGLLLGDRVDFGETNVQDGIESIIGVIVTSHNINPAQDKKKLDYAIDIEGMPETTPLNLAIRLANPDFVNHMFSNVSYQPSLALTQQGKLFKSAKVFKPALFELLDTAWPLLQNHKRSSTQEIELQKLYAVFACLRTNAAVQVAATAKTSFEGRTFIEALNDYISLGIVDDTLLHQDATALLFLHELKSIDPSPLNSLLSLMLNLSAVKSKGSVLAYLATQYSVKHDFLTTLFQIGCRLSATDAHIIKQLRADQKFDDLNAVLNGALLSGDQTIVDNVHDSLGPGSINPMLLRCYTNTSAKQPQLLAALGYLIVTDNAVDLLKQIRQEDSQLYRQLNLLPNGHLTVFGQTETISQQLARMKQDIVAAATPERPEEPDFNVKTKEDGTIYVKTYEIVVALFTAPLQHSAASSAMSADAQESPESRSSHSSDELMQPQADTYTHIQLPSAAQSSQRKSEVYEYNRLQRPKPPAVPDRAGKPKPDAADATVLIGGTGTFKKKGPPTAPKPTAPTITLPTPGTN